MNLVFVLEMIGTISFAFSGAVVAIRNRLDIFGVVILGMTCAVGGGIIRDLILGVIPPIAFQNPIYAFTAIMVSIVIFILANSGKVIVNKGKESIFYTIADSIGLGVFSVVALKSAFQHAPECGIFLAVFVAVLTGIGGGVLCDMFAGVKPHVFVKHFYASASIIGSLITAIIWNTVGEGASMVIGIFLIVGIRLVAAHFHWNLPVAHID